MYNVSFCHYWSVHIGRLLKGGGAQTVAHQIMRVIGCRLQPLCSVATNRTRTVACSRQRLPSSVLTVAFTTESKRDVTQQIDKTWQVDEWQGRGKRTEDWVSSTAATAAAAAVIDRLTYVTRHTSVCTSNSHTAPNQKTTMLLTINPTTVFARV